MTGIKNAKKAYLLGAIIVLIALIIILIIAKLTTTNNFSNTVTDSGTKAKSASFAPASQPKISADEKVIGSTRASIKVVVYEDYSNIFSADNADNIEKLKTEFGDKIVVAVRPYATREKPVSLEAAMSIECAGEQGEWKEMREGVFRAVRVNSLNTDGISGWAKQLGLDQDEFTKCLTDTEKQGIMLQVAENAQNFSVYGAPTIFVNDELVVGARPYDDYTDEDGVKIEGLKNLVARQLIK